MFLLHGTTDTPQANDQATALSKLVTTSTAIATDKVPASEQSFFSKYWVLLVLGGILLVSAAGPEYLHRKYGRR
jgi:hypothetical protein